jgi:hypothetical protein
MREVNVYDERRHPAWLAALEPGEYAVFHVDAETERVVSADGLRPANHWKRTCLVFPSLEEALAYAEAAVRRVPSVACRVFRAGGDGATPDRVVTCPDPPRMDRRRASRRLAWGATLIVLGVVAIAVDWHFDWFYLIGVLVGVKFLTVGFVRFIEGYVALRDHRRAT